MDYKNLMKAVGVQPTVTHNCPKCTGPVRCDIERGLNTCWCFNVQAKGLEMNEACMCKSCLTAIPD